MMPAQRDRRFPPDKRRAQVPRASESGGIAYLAQPLPLWRSNGSTPLDRPPRPLAQPREYARDWPEHQIVDWIETSTLTQTDNCPIRKLFGQLSDCKPGGLSCNISNSATRVSISHRSASVAWVSAIPHAGIRSGR